MKKDYKITSFTFKGLPAKVDQEFRVVSTEVNKQNDDITDEGKAAINKRKAKKAIAGQALDMIYSTSASVMTSGFIGMLTTKQYSVMVSLFVIGLVTMSISAISKVLVEIFFKDSG